MHLGSDAIKFAVVGLRRRINRIRHQIREATRKIELAHDSLEPPTARDFRGVP